MENTPKPADISFDMYRQFHLTQFGVEKTEADYTTDASRAVIRQGWVLAADLTDNIQESRRTDAYGPTFAAHFSAEQNYAALFLANYFLKKILYFEWRTENVFYCPPGQTIQDAYANQESPGFTNYLYQDTPYIYSDDELKEWRTEPFGPLSAKLGNSRIASTTSTNHQNRALMA
ncbi:hypothetical protein ACFPMF_08680 [Larkinella bovis]|uniref:Uncharacterized protein n=1 Tax=Larkinella bovis TaxID=683041 RepID=A0ABW0I7W9_9BACT